MAQAEMTKLNMNRNHGAFVALEAKAEQVSALLNAMANPKRLMVLCSLVEGEMNAGQLASTVQLSPAALSQHLAKMREAGLIKARRDGQMIHYTLASAEVRVILETLYHLYCMPEIEDTRTV